MANPFVEDIAARVGAAAGLAPAEVAQTLTTPPNPKMGDYCFPCFNAAKAQKRKPNEVAQELAAKLIEGGYGGKVQMVGPYLNFFINRADFAAWALGQVHHQKKHYGHTSEFKGRKLVVDYSSPNICKHLSIYHVRNTMVGHALCQLHRAQGWTVVGINHLGDWGTQFGLLIAGFKRWGNENVFLGDAVEKLQDLYVKANEEAKKDEAFAAEGRTWFLKLEQGDAEALALWKRFRDASLAAFFEVYETLGVKFDVIGGESLARDEMPRTIERAKAKGLATMSDGALIVDLSDMKMPPMMLLKSDGGTRYETRDLATAELRHEQHQFDKMIYVTGQDQKLYFRQLFETLRRMGYAWAERLRHVAHGMTRIAGERMRTRTGGAVKLRDVLAEAVERELEIVVSREPEATTQAAAKAQAEHARLVAIGSIIFHDLKREVTKDIDFDWDEVLQWEGDTGAYVQYAHARICSILRKHGKPVSASVETALLSTDEEYLLVRKVAEFGEEIGRAVERLEPSMICRYLLDLCALLSDFYGKHKVLCEDEKLAEARVALVDAVRQTIANGLALLGVGAPEGM